MQAKPQRTQARSGWRAGRKFTRLDPWGVAACALVLLAIPLVVHARKYPDFASFWTGLDQQRYLASAKAWSQFDLTPSNHHYLPLYPLLGAAFVWLTPWQPFLVPDVLCLLASLFLFVRIGRRLAPTWPDSVLAACFVVASMGGRVLVAIWVVPWSTTGCAPCQFAAVLLALRFGEKPRAIRALLLGTALALVAGFRPSDAAVLTVCAGVFVAWSLMRTASPPSAWFRAAGAGALGVALGILPTLAAHLAIFGAHQGAYLQKAAGIGLEWRLIPLRWVMLVADARPLLPEERGLAETLPWVLPGLAGLLLGLMPRPGHRPSAAALVAGTVALHWATYLAYRDLQPYGLWRFYNVHYFKWTFPFLALWAAQWLAALALPANRPRAALAFGLAAASLTWRPVFRQTASFALVGSGLMVNLPPDTGQVDRAVWLPLHGEWAALYFGKFTISMPGRELANTPDFKVLPVPTGALLLPLRPWQGSSILTLPQEVHIGPGQGSIGDIRLRFDVPCGVSITCPPSIY